jgi:hypothetical protein
MYMGWPLLSSIRSAKRSGCGQVSGGPSEVLLQSWARISAPIAPPPSRNLKLEELALPDMVTDFEAFYLKLELGFRVWFARQSGTRNR